MITLYSKNTNTKLAYLDDIIIEDSIEVTRKINGEFTLKFDVLEDNLKCGYFGDENYVAIDNFYFDIVYIEQIHSESVTYRIECENVTYRLIEDEKEFYTYDGTPLQILTDILAGTEFIVGTVEPSTITTFAVHEETNKLGLLQLLAYHTNAELDFDGFKISLKNTLGQNRGFQARFGKNLTGVKKIIDRRKGLTYYAVDIVELRNHPSFKGFEELEIIEEGDTIRIIDEVIGLDVANKVIKRTYNPIRSINTSLEIANSIEILTDSITKIRRDTVAKNKVYHGIRISPDTGFESIRSDKMARGVFNSDTFALQTGDGTGSNWINKLYFDPAKGEYIFDGKLSATLIEALEAEFDITISNVTITNVLAAETGYIAQLTVDSLDTSTKVHNFLKSDVSDINYIRIRGHVIQFVTASVVGENRIIRTGSSTWNLTSNPQVATYYSNVSMRDDGTLYYINGAEMSAWVAYATGRWFRPISDTSYYNITGGNEQAMGYSIHEVVTEGANYEHLKTDKGYLYWTDDDKVSVTFETTSYPVYVYVYNELVKAEYSFVYDEDNYTPTITLGTGDGILEKSAKGEIFKDTEGLHINYYRNNTGELSRVFLNDDGVNINNLIIENRTDDPVDPVVGQIWMRTDLA